METTPKHPKTAALFTALLAALDISASKLAREISTFEGEYSQQRISNYVAGNSKANEVVLAAIVERYKNVSARFLLTGEGDPFPTGRYNEKPAAAPSIETDKPAEAVVPMLPSVETKKLTPVADEDATTSIDLTRRYIDRLEKELNASQRREEYWQDKFEQLEKPEPAPSATWFAPANEISLRPTACAKPQNSAGGKVIAMYAETELLQEAS